MGNEIALIVSGLRYSGFKSVRVTRSIESIVGSFSLDVSDRWDGALKPWTILEEDACRVEINGQVVIDGYIDKRRHAIDAETRSLGYDGRDKASALVDCSAIVDAGSVGKGGKWTFYNVDVVALANEVAKPFGIPVAVQSGLGPLLAKDKKFVVHPGDTGFDILSRAATAAGVLVVSDGRGGIVITRAGSGRATTPLIYGQNIKAATFESDAVERYRHYLLSSQVPGTDDASGDACRVQAIAVDLGVRRVERVLLIRPDKGYNGADAQRRADWEARVRAARAQKVSVTVQGWQQRDGSLWPLGALTRVKVPLAGGIDGDLMISSIEHAISAESGTLTTLGLVRPDAFTPEPTATVKDPSGAGGWIELKKGAF